MSTDFTPDLILVDGSSYLFRAYHALPPLMTSSGQPTGAVFGVINMIKRLRMTYPDPIIAVVFDAKGKTFRHDLFPAYKANRPAMPDDLASQITPLHELIRAMGLPLISVPGIEADDVIGTLAAQAETTGKRILISTGDKDMAQLVNDQVQLVNTMHNKYYDRSGVMEKYGVTPEQIIDYLALMGDSSDNIPGVEKVGPKTAAKWLAQYETLDAIMAAASEFKGKVGEYLRAALGRLPLNRTLVTIRCNADLPVALSDLQTTAPDMETLQNLTGTLEFRAWHKELLAGNTGGISGETTKPAVPLYYYSITNWQDFDAWFEKLSTAEAFAFDTETTALDNLSAEIVGLSFSLSPREAIYIPLGHTGDPVPEQLPRAEVLSRLKPLFENPVITKIGQNVKYDLGVLKNVGIHLAGHIEDTMLASYVKNSTATRHNLDALARHYLDTETIDYESVTGKGRKQISFAEVSIDAATRYAAEDADIALRLHQHFKPTFTANEKLRAVYEEIELPLIPVLSNMERHGVLIDTDCLHTQSAEIAAELQTIEAEAYALAGCEFNLGSPKQLQEVLFEKNGMPVRVKTPTGQASTAEDALQALAVDYPLAKIILSHRSLSKLKNTYLDRLPEQVHPKTGRIHTAYHQAVTATGRLSSSDPNLQNIPVRTEAGRRIRQAFIAPAGYQILAADYSQIELRIMAHLSQDPVLLTAFAENADVHRATAAEVFGIAPDAVTALQRRSAKAINFGLMYGMSAFGLSKQLGIEKGAAQDYIDRYFARFERVRAYMENTREIARSQGFVETLFGRRLYLPDITHRNFQIRQAAERAAINAPMQGTAADIIKLAMIALSKIFTDNRTVMVMQVHDELVFEVKEIEIDWAQNTIKHAMENAATLDVPLLVECGVGDNWEAAH